jgi:hypothetical protein
MKPSYRDIDAIVRAGLNGSEAERSAWEIDLPADCGPRILATVDAPPPRFREQIPPDSPESVPAEMHLHGTVLVLGVLSVLSFFLGALIAWWHESGLIFAASVGVSLGTLALTAWLHARRTDDKWRAFGLTPPASDADLFATQSLLVKVASIADTFLHRCDASTLRRSPVPDSKAAGRCQLRSQSAGG